MSKGTTLDTLLVEKDAGKLLRDVYRLTPEKLIGFIKDERFDRFTAKVSRAIKRNKKLVAKIRGGKSQ